MKRPARFLCGLALAACATLPAPATAAECVILLHGLARSKASMHVLDDVLTRAGYEVVNQGYPSRRHKIERLAEDAISDARAQCTAPGPPHVVTHSMGGILLRAYAEAHPDEPFARVVMLGPPNHGSEVVSAYGDLKAFEILNGPASLQLAPGGLPDHLPPAPFELGVIAGTRSLNPLLSASIDGANDGKVAVSSTRLAGMSAHLSLPVTHTFMMIDPRVSAQVLSFLETGAFEPELTAGQALRRIAGD